MRLYRLRRDCAILYVGSLSVVHVCYRSTFDSSCHSAVVLLIFSVNKKCFLIALLGALRSNDWDTDGNENVKKKTIGFISKTTTLHVHHVSLYISLPGFARLRREHA